MLSLVCWIWKKRFIILEGWDHIKFRDILENIINRNYLVEL